METEKRTAEEILESTAGHPIDAMYQYARQELAEYKARLKEAIHEAIDDPEGIVDRDFIRAKAVYQLIDKL